MTGAAGKRRPLHYGDVLVLVRRRGKAFDAIIQALKHAGVAVAGADRLKLTEHIAIIDLMNLTDALLLSPGSGRRPAKSRKRDDCNAKRRNSRHSGRSRGRPFFVEA